MFLTPIPQMRANGGWECIYLERRLLRFCLGCAKLRKFNTQPRDRATVDVCGICLYPLCTMTNSAQSCFTYRRGLLRCLSLVEGQCEGLAHRISNRYRFPRFFYVRPGNRSLSIVNNLEQILFTR